MIPIASHITAFLRERLPVERMASPNTCDTYAYAFQLLFEFAGKKLKAAPSDLCLEQLDAPLILAFLAHLENDRGCCPSTRNARLTAIKSFFRYVQYRVPSSLDQVRSVLAVPIKNTQSRLVSYLTVEEMKFLLNAPDPNTRDGIRDRGMLQMAFDAGLRVSELVHLRLDDVSFQPTVHILVRGKGRRERQLPLCKETATTLRAWLAIRGKAPAPELFLNAADLALTRSGFKYILAKHVTKAADRCPSLTKKRVSPHVLRHSCAMMVLQATKDLRKVSLWLGHAQMQTREVYLKADPTEKLETIESITHPHLRRGHFRPVDKLLASLRAPKNMRS
jgi:site-specific recombinase XerD